MQRLGPHVLSGSDAARAWARVAGICKQVDNTDLLEVAPDDAIRIFRPYVPDWRQANISPEEYVALLLERLGSYRHRLLYVELLNEWHCSIEWVRRAVELLHAAGLLVAGPSSWGTGDYGADEWERFRAAGWCGLDAIALHCYWAGAGFTPWNALRYRSYWRPGDPPIIVSECGRDRVRDGDLAVNDGWIGAAWRTDGVSPEQYAAELRAYAAELVSDAYVLGATVFTVGANDRWRDYDVDEFVPDLANLTAPSVAPVTIDRPITPQEPTVPDDSKPQFVLGFKAEADRLGRSIVGEPIEDEHYFPDGQTSLQQTTKGLLVYSKAGNRAGFVPFA